MEPISLSQGRLRAPLLRIQSDERLARLAAGGDRAAFEVIVRRHRPALLRACGRILPDARAEDAVQQALLSAQQALERNGAPERFEPWLNRIAVNAALKELKRTPQELPLDEQRIDGVEQPTERLERRERLRAALAALASLPEGQRRALVMRELEGRSHAEIAQVLGLSAGAARQLIHRARGAMRSAATALTPYGFLARMAGGESSTQTAEIVAGGTAGALAGKAVATLVVAGGIVGGVALAPQDSGPEAEGDKGVKPPGIGVGTAEGSDGEGGDGDRRGREGGEGRRHRGEGSGDGRRRSGDDEDGHDDDHSESGSGQSGGDGGEGHEGSGSSGESESSGSGSGSGSESSGSGSGSSSEDELYDD